MDVGTRDRTRFWINAQHLSRIRKRGPDIAAADGESERSSLRQRKWSCGRCECEPVETEKRRGPDLQRPQILPAFCERPDRRRKLPACEDGPRAPVEFDDQARTRTAATHVLDGDEEPLAHVRQVRRLAAD